MSETYASGYFCVDCDRERPACEQFVCASCGRLVCRQCATERLVSEVVCPDCSPTNHDAGERRPLFYVVHADTGAPVTADDMEQIALNEAWADGLIYCDMEGFLLDSDGDLWLADECGAYRCAPEGRFNIVWLRDPREVVSRD